MKKFVRTTKTEKQRVIEARLAVLSQTYSLRSSGDGYCGYSVTEFHSNQGRDAQIDRLLSRSYSGTTNSHGIPGEQLLRNNDSSSRNWGLISAGYRGEVLLYNLLRSSFPNLNTFWSLPSFDLMSRKGDIDCIAIGRDKRGITHAYIIDAKNYVGDSNTLYTQLDSGTLIRINRRAHCLQSSHNTSLPILSLSAGVAIQRDELKSYLPQGIKVHAVVCILSEYHGMPSVESLAFPNGVPACNYYTLCRWLARDTPLSPSNEDVSRLEDLKESLTNHVHPIKPSSGYSQDMLPNINFGNSTEVSNVES